MFLKPGDGTIYAQIVHYVSEFGKWAREPDVMKAFKGAGSTSGVNARCAPGGMMATVRSDRLPKQRPAPRSKLTEKQKAFADRIAFGERPADTLRAVYPASEKWRGRRAASTALKLRGDPRIVARIEDLLKRVLQSRGVVATLAAGVRH